MGTGFPRKDFKISSSVHVCPTRQTHGIFTQQLSTKMCFHPTSDFQFFFLAAALSQSDGCDTVVTSRSEVFVYRYAAEPALRFAFTAVELQTLVCAMAVSQGLRKRQRGYDLQLCICRNRDVPNMQALHR